MATCKDYHATVEQIGDRLAIGAIWLEVQERKIRANPCFRVSLEDVVW